MFSRSTSFLVALFASAVSCGALAGEKPIVINFTSGMLTDVDRHVIEQFDKSYTVVNIDASDPKHSYKLPKGISGFGLETPAYIDKRCVSGTVLVAYLITVDGAVTSLVALNSTDPLLDDIAKQRMAARLFQPAELDGKPAASIAVTRLSFPCKH